MIFEEFDVLEKESDKFVVVRNSIERLDSQKFVEFILRGRKFYLQLSDEVFVGDYGCLCG